MSTNPSFAKSGPVRLRPLFPDRSADDETSSIGVESLPRPLTSLIGRAAEVAAARAMLIGSRIRFLTLTGPGGVGKTRLALQIAADAAPAFADGVVFISLAPITDPALVLPTIARELGLREIGRRSLIESLVAHLQSLEVLLVLDNFEHLLASAPLLSNIVAACPRLSILVTSRSVLHLSGEHGVSVPPLTLPGDDGKQAPQLELADVAHSEAVQLFVARAKAVQPEFVLSPANAAAIAEICRRLDGLPLAIELAAARLRTLSPAALLARLEQRFVLLAAGPLDVPDRLRTMRDAIAWSYDLLSDDERALFRCLAVFAGGFTLEAAEYAGPERGVSPSILDRLAALIDHSLLRRTERADGEPRFGMLETIREFGLEQLSVNGELETARRRHAEHFVAQAEAARTILWSSLPGVEQTFWLDRLERENDNLRAALTWAVDADPELALRFCGDLSYYWWQRGFLREGLEWTNRVLGPDVAALPASAAQALYAASLLSGELGDYDRGAALGEEALARYHELGDPDGIRRSVQIIGIAAMQSGQHDRAAALFDELLARSRALGHVRAISVALALLGSVTIKRGDYERAHQLLSEALALGRQHNDRFGLAWFLFKCGQLERAQGNNAAAVAHVRESLALYQELASTARASVCLLTIAALVEPTVKAEQVVRLLGAAEAHGHAEAGDVLDIDPADQEQLLERLRARLDEATFDRAWSAGRGLSLEDSVAEALSLTAASPAESNAAGAVTPTPANDLTSREQEVLRYLATGLSDKEIAVALNISRRTVSSHIAAIRAKLDAPSRTAAATIAVRDGFI